MGAGTWGCPTRDVTLWFHGLNAHERLEGTGCAPGLVSSGGNLACVLRNCYAQQTKAQQMEMSGRIASKAQSEPKHQCCWILGLPSQFLLCHWTSHGASWGLLESSPVLSLERINISGSNILSCWSCVPNEHTTMQWAIFWYYCNGRVVLEQMCGQERTGQYCCIYLQHLWQVQKFVLLCKSVWLNDREKDREVDYNFYQYLGKDLIILSSLGQ